MWSSATDHQGSPLQYSVLAGFRFARGNLGPEEEPALSFVMIAGDGGREPAPGVGCSAVWGHCHVTWSGFVSFLLVGGIGVQTDFKDELAQKFLF